MRIGELAALVGVSTRTVRHYHHLGLLPEAERRTNGYREYGLRDAIVLARVRRMAELGLSLDEIRDVLPDDQGKELREILADLDADLARQQEEIGARRARLAELLAETDLHPDSTVSPDMAVVLRGLAKEGSEFARFDRELLALMDSVADPIDRDEMRDLMRDLMRRVNEPGGLDSGHALYARLDDLADADPTDSRVPAVAAELAAYLPDEMARAITANLSEDVPRTDGSDHRSGARTRETGALWMAEVLAALAPAQAEVLRLTVTILKNKPLRESR